VPRLAQDDLTGAALVALMRLSFAEQGLPGFASGVPDRASGPHASLGAKQKLAEDILTRFGPAPLLRVGQSVTRMAFDPVGAALLAAQGGLAVVERWTRLERYLHTRHPIRVAMESPRVVIMDHRGDPADPPSPAVDLVLAGVIGGLMQAAGCRDLSITLGDGSVLWPVMEHDSLVPDTLMPGSLLTGLWRFAWNDEVQNVASSLHLFDQPDAPLARLSRTVTAQVEADLLRVWGLVELARTLGVSARTLQRRLAQDGLTLKKVRRDAQVKRASELLIEGVHGLSAIGFACGFSDAAHFTRVFRMRSGMTPSAFRAALRPSAGSS
jgi:AraC-like DNA-binding protein